VTFLPLSPSAIRRLTELCAPERVVTDPELLADYGHDESVETPHLPEALSRSFRRRKRRR
jgi:hypothetical protein